MKKVYLAGALFNEGEIKQRIHETELLMEAGIDVFSPIKQEYNSNKTDKITPEEIFINDYDAVKECDIFLADITNEDAGVMAELGIAYESGKDIIAVCSDIRLKSANAYEVPSYGVNHFVLGLIEKRGKLVYSFSEALDILKEIK